MDETVQLISNRYLQSETCTKQRNVRKPPTEMTDFSSADPSFPPSTHPSIPPYLHLSIHPQTGKLFNLYNINNFHYNSFITSIYIAPLQVGLLRGTCTLGTCQFTQLTKVSFKFLLPAPPPVFDPSES